MRHNSHLDNQPYAQDPEDDDLLPIFNDIDEDEDEDDDDDWEEEYEDDEDDEDDDWEDDDDDDEDDDDWDDEDEEALKKNNPYAKVYRLNVEAGQQQLCVDLVFCLASKDDKFYTIPGIIKATHQNGTPIPKEQLGHIVTNEVLRAALESLLWLWEEDEDFQGDNPGLGLQLQEQLKL